MAQEACWTLSNIAAGTPKQLASMCDSPGILARVIEVLSSDAWEVQKEANFVVSNVATASGRESLHAVWGFRCMHHHTRLLLSFGVLNLRSTQDALSQVSGDKCLISKS